MCNGRRNAAAPPLCCRFVLHPRELKPMIPRSRCQCVGAVAVERSGAEASMVGEAAAAAARYRRVERLRDSFAGLEGYSFCPQA